jgi:hypothetical protein
MYTLQLQSVLNNETRYYRKIFAGAEHLEYTVKSLFNELLGD